MNFFANLRRRRAAANEPVSQGFRRGTARSIFVDVCATGLAAFLSFVIAAALGAAGRGEYAAIMAWWGVVLVVGEFGQGAATCYYTASEPNRARDHVATARNLIVITSGGTFVVGFLVAPLLSGGRSDLTAAYQIAFVASVVYCLATPYLAGLQSSFLNRWNLARASQSVFFLMAIGILLALDRMTVLNVILAFLGTVLCYAVFTCLSARKSRLTGGRGRQDMIGPLARYGASQMIALAPLTLNARLDQIVLSQTVPAADLGRYAVAVGLTTLALPFVKAIGAVAFPRLASSQAIPGGTSRFQRLALLGSAGVATSVLLPLAVIAPWLIPFALGPEFQEATDLIWILSFGGVFLACGYVAADLLRGRNRPADVAGAHLVGTLVNFALLFALLPVLGVRAAALASTLGYSISFAIMVRQLCRLPDESHPPQAHPG